MVFKCQENSFLREFTSKVTSCDKVQFNSVINSKKVKLDGYEVICENTILFPEGGGQPCDHGFLNDKEVHQVLRRGDTAIHFTTEPFNVGEDVRQVVNWDRRLDHMQQHSGQHLITAIIDKEFKFSTVSWWLGEEVSHIELDTPSITKEQAREAEQICNELIREGRRVSVDVISENGDGSTSTDQVRARGLPEDHKGDIRIVTIENVESNMCCGTHVSNLCQLQVIKLLHWERSARKNNTLLYFVVGNRVISKLNSSLEREQKLTSLLNNAPTQHVDLVEKLLKSTKSLSKNLQTVLKDLVAYEVDTLKKLPKPPKYFLLHRKEANSDYMNQFVKLMATNDIFLVLTTGDEKGAGNLVLYGHEQVISDLGNRICETLDGKGAGKGVKFQAKVNNLGNRNKVEALLKEYFN